MNLFASEFFKNKPTSLLKGKENIDLRAAQWIWKIGKLYQGFKKIEDIMVVIVSGAKLLKSDWFRGVRLIVNRTITTFCTLRRGDTFVPLLIPFSTMPFGRLYRFIIITKEFLHCSDFFLMKTKKKVCTAIASSLTKKKKNEVFRNVCNQKSLDHVFFYYLLTITSESYDLSCN